MHKVYGCLQNADLTEGRGPMVAKAYFSTYEDATQFLHTLDGVMGSNQGLEVKTFEVYDSLSEHPSWTEARIRETALKKLSPEERKVLGV